MSDPKGPINRKYTFLWEMLLIKEATGELKPAPRERAEGHFGVTVESLAHFGITLGI